MVWPILISVKPGALAARANQTRIVRAAVTTVPDRKNERDRLPGRYAYFGRKQSKSQLPKSAVTGRFLDTGSIEALGPGS
jgi:hypothetical protein